MIIDFLRDNHAEIERISSNLNFGNCLWNLLYVRLETWFIGLSDLIFWQSFFFVDHVLGMFVLYSQIWYWKNFWLFSFHAIYIFVITWILATSNTIHILLGFDSV